MSITTYLEDIINDPEINQWKKLYTSLDLREIKDIIPDIKEITTEKRETKEIEIENIIYEKEDVCLIGEAGCGKTTSLRWLTLMLAQKADENAIPLYADLTNFTPDYTNFEKFVKYILKSRSFPIDGAEELLKKGSFIIFVDGLDTLSIERIDLIGEFISNFPDNRFILSSREEIYYEQLDIKKKWNVLPLDDEKKKSCVKKYIGKEKADEFFDAIESSQQKDAIEDLISNPLMLWLTIDVFRDNRKLPKNKTEIYREYVWYYYKHTKKRQVKIKHKRHMIENALSEIAFVMHCNNKFSIEEETVYNFLENVEDDCTKLNFVSVIESKAGNFVKVAPHPSFQEYFCALKLNKLYGVGMDISVTFTHPRWENILIFLSGMLEDSSELVKEIMKYDLNLAAKCIEAGKVDSSVRINVISKLHELAESKFEYDREKAVGSLGRIGGDESVEILIGGLKEEGSVRGRAADALGEIGSERVVEHLAKALSDENSWVVRRTAIDALGKIGSEEAVEHLIKSLSDENRDVRGNVADALGEIGSERVVEHLAKALSDENSWVRGRATNALIKIGSEKAVEHLAKALSEGNSSVRDEAARALREIGSEEAVEHLIKSLSDENRDVRSKAAEALGKIGDVRSVDTVMYFLFKYQPQLYTTPFINTFGDYANFIIDIISYEKEKRTESKWLYRSVDYYTYDLHKSDKAIDKLCEINTPISSNILHKVVHKRDIEVRGSYDHHCDSSTVKTLSFKSQREMAKKELKRRGNPPYDPSAYLKKENWKL